MLILPEIPDVRHISQSFALLDAILSPEWEFRYYSFNAHWDKQEAMASMRNGEGDHYFIWFNPAGAVLKGFAHESVMSPFRVNPPQLWSGIFDNFPPQFKEFLTEPAFVIEVTTFCVWRLNEDAAWQSGAIQFPAGHDPDGSARLLKLLDGKPETYQQWAQSYFEVPVSLPVIIDIYQHQRITEQIIKALNPELSIDDLTDDLEEIGYSL